MKIAFFSVLPGGQHFPGQADHGLGVAGDAGAMKSGLRQAPLAQPKIPFARQQACPEKTPVGAQHAALGEFGGLVDEHIRDSIGMGNEILAMVKKAEADDVAVIFHRLRQKTKGVPAVEAEFFRPTIGAGRKPFPRHIRDAIALLRCGQSQTTDGRQGRRYR